MSTSNDVLRQALEALRYPLQRGEFTRTAETLHRNAIVAIDEELKKPNVETLHRASAYAKNHAQEHADGYDKKAFGYVQFWMHRINK